MVFKTIKIQNFFSFGPEEQSLDLSTPGVYLITGRNFYNNKDDEFSSNGSGKSSLIEAISFALFGKVTKDVNLPEIVNEQTGKNCKVELTFELNGNDYIVQRFRAHEKEYDRVYFYKGSIDKENSIAKANIKDTQEEIEKLIKFNFKSFINAVMMSQENISGFLQSDISSAKRKEIIENILQLNNITKYHWIAQQKRKLAKKEYEFLTREKENNENLVESVKNSVEEYLNSCKRQKKENEKEIEKLQERLEKISNIDIDEERNKLQEAERLSNNIESMMTSYRHKMDEIKNIKNEVESIESSQLEYKSFMKSYVKENKKLEKEVENYTKKLGTLKEEISEAEENPETCPVCKGEINKHDHTYWLQQRKEEVETIESEIEYKNNVIEENKEKIQGWMDKVKELEKNKKDVNRRVDEEKENASQIKEEYESIEIPETMSEDELTKLYNERANIETKIEEKKDKEFVDENYLNNLKKQIKNYKKQLSETEDKIKDSEKRFVILRWWENALSSKKKSMKTWCINNIIGYFNAKIKYYVDRFFNGDVELTLDNDLNETILAGGSERTFGQFSGGEKRRLNLAVLFALNSLIKANVSTKINIMFLDEVLSSHLDEKGISTVLELLEELKDKKNSVYLIDHKENFKDYPSFENIQILKTKDGYSYINK